MGPKEPVNSGLSSENIKVGHFNLTGLDIVLSNVNFFTLYSPW